MDPQAPVGLSGSRPVVNFMNNEQIDARDEQNRRKLESVASSEPVISSLASHVRGCFSDAHAAKGKNGITERLLDAQRRRRGEYAPAKKAEILAMGGTLLFSKDTDTKCNAAEAIMTDILMPQGDENTWGCTPTRVPTLPDEVSEQVIQTTLMQVATEVQASGQVPSEEVIFQYSQNLREEVLESIWEEALERSENMSRVMTDQLQEMHWEKTFNEFRSNEVTFGTGFIKGPIVKHTKKMGWAGGEYTVLAKLGLDSTAPSPLDMFPSDASVNVEDGFMIERVRSNPKSLSGMKGNPYWQTKEIEYILTTHPNGYTEVMPDDQARANVELAEAPQNRKAAMYDMLEFWGSISGTQLADWGFPGLVPTDYYDFQVMTCANRVLKVMPNPDPLGRSPYFKACYKQITGSFWGNGVPHLISDQQDLANGAIRAIANNMMMASGPMVAIDVNRLPPGTKIESLHPWQLFQFENPSGLPTDPIKFFQPQSNVNELLAVYAAAVRKMDDESGIPAYQYGSEKASGAGRTAHGLSMLMNASARLIKEALVQMDLNVVEPYLERVYVWNMFYNPDESIKGDAQVVTYGPTKMLMRDMKQARLAELTDRVAGNPVGLQLVGPDVVADLYKMNAEMVDHDVGKLFPDGETVRKRLAAMPPEEGPGASGGKNSAGTPAKQEHALAA